MNEALTQDEPKKSSSLVDDWKLLTLSGRSIGELWETLAYYELLISSTDALDYSNTISQLNGENKHFPYRLAIVTNNLYDLHTQILGHLNLSDTEKFKLFMPQACSQSKRIAFLCGGAGTQYINMGRRLYETQPIFRDSIDKYQEILSSISPISLFQVLYPDKSDTSQINEIRYTQPVIFAFELALIKWWESLGVVPDFLLGHSLGEYVAACVAGIFSIEDGFKIVVARGRLMQTLSSDVEMIAVFTNLEKTLFLLGDYIEKVSIAAENGPQSTVISGSSLYMREITKIFEEQDISTHKLNIERAGHSREMLPIIPELKRTLETITFSTPKLKIVSNVTGELISNEMMNPDYWCSHTCQTVLFKTGMEYLGKQDIDVFIEIAPQSILLGLGHQCLPNNTALWLPSLRIQKDDINQLLINLAKLYESSIEFDYTKIGGI